jgi:outer membrane receptor protein involved in Fe transport
MNMTAVDHLQLDLAARREKYTEFKGSWTPKVGMTWAPVAPLELRMTYGRSTRNPSFDEQDVSGNAYLIVPTVEPASGNIQNVLALTGQSSELQPEKATTWTAGFDLHFGEHKAFDLQVTYFDITFRNRIAYPITGDILPAGSNQSPYTSYIHWDPSVEETLHWTQSPNYFPQPGQDPTQIDVIVDNRLQNIAVMHVSGIDGNITYVREVAEVKVSGLLRGEYLMHHDRQVLPGEPRVSLRSTIYNPVALRLRGGFTAERGKFVGALFANYIDRYTDNRLPESADIGSWTTVDLNLLYSMPMREHATALDGMTVGLNVGNLLNQRPPYVSGANHVNFDGANASALLRFIGIEIGKKW